MKTDLWKETHVRMKRNILHVYEPREPHLRVCLSSHVKKDLSVYKKGRIYIWRKTYVHRLMYIWASWASSVRLPSIRVWTGSYVITCEERPVYIWRGSYVHMKKDTCTYVHRLMYTWASPARLPKTGVWKETYEKRPMKRDLWKETYVHRLMYTWASPARLPKTGVWKETYIKMKRVQYKYEKRPMEEDPCIYEKRQWYIYMSLIGATAQYGCLKRV